jgi:hypothetical protein
VAVGGEPGEQVVLVQGDRPGHFFGELADSEHSAGAVNRGEGDKGIRPESLARDDPA